MKISKRTNYLFRSIGLLVLLLLTSSTSQSQVKCLNVNGGFETLIPCTAGSFPLAFFDGCVDNWSAVNGSPDHCSDCLTTDIQPPVNGGEYYAAMSVYHTSNSDGCRNDALFMKADLTPGKTYELSFYHRTASETALNPIDIKIFQSHDVTGNPNNQPQPSPCSDLVLPADSEIIFSKDDYMSGVWTQETVCFIANDYPNYGLAIFPEQQNSNNTTQQFWMIDRICINEFVGCEAITDLTACVDEEDYGYIAYDCPGYYQWDFPTGSTAVKFSSPQHSVVLQASPGIYNVTITNNDGCTKTESWEVVEKCCDIICDPPSGLYCEYNQGGVQLFWNQVPGATGYIVSGIANDPNCECNDSQDPTPINIPVNGDYPTVDISEYPCFSWTVQTICGDATISEPSEVMCFNSLFQDCFKSNFSDIPDRKNRLDNETNFSNGSVNIFPNPSNDIFNINIELKKESNLRLEIFDLQGKRVENKNASRQSGLVNLKWTPEAKLDSGSYYVKITTDDWSSTYKIVHIKK